MDVMVSGKLTVVSDIQFSKIELPVPVTLLGIVTDSNDVHPLKALLLMYVGPFSITMVTIEVA